MPVRRETRVASDPATVYEVARGRLFRHVESSAFEITEDDPGRALGIGWRGALGSSRYRFQIGAAGIGDRGIGAGGTGARGTETRVAATLWLGGLAGPFHALFHRRRHSRHLDRWLRDIKQAAEEATAKRPTSPPNPP